jgi:hypothetical protein
MDFNTLLADRFCLKPMKPFFGVAKQQYFTLPCRPAAHHSTGRYV